MAIGHPIRPFLLVSFVLTLLAFHEPAEAIPVACITCGSTALVGPGIEGTVSYAVLSGVDFNNEVLGHSSGFFGLVPSGTLGPAVNPLPTDFVYLYELVNDGPSADFISSWTLSGGLVGPAAITSGTRLESTLFVDPSIPGLVSAGPAGATTGLGAGGTVDFENGLGDPQPVPVIPWGACLGSGPAGVQCSDGQADLFAASVVVSNWQETPTAIDLDPQWSGTVVWFASPFGPGTGNASITDGIASASGSIPVPVPEPSTALLVALGLGAMARARRGRFHPGGAKGSM